MPHPILRATLVAISLSLLPGPAFAQENFAPPPPVVEEGEEEWEWVMLKSGEWLKGEIKSVRKDKMEFESDELDNLTLDWEDIRRIISPRFRTYVFTNRRIVSGTAMMADGRITVRELDGASQEFLATEVISIVAGGTRRGDLWSGKGGFSVVTRSGNTNQEDITLTLRLRRATPLTRFQIDAASNVGRIEEQRNVNNHSLTAAIDLYASQRFYVTLLTLDFFSDEFQNIDLRASPGTGLGYQLVDRKTIEFELGLTGGFQWTRYGSVQEGEDLEATQGQITPSATMNWDITGDIELDVDANARLGVPEIKNSFFHAGARLSFDLTDVWEFDSAFTWDRVQNPQPDDAGVTPERDDYRSSWGLSLEF